MPVSLKGFAGEVYVSTTIVKANWRDALNDFGVPDVPILTGKTGEAIENEENNCADSSNSNEFKFDRKWNVNGK